MAAGLTMRRIPSQYIQPSGGLDIQSAQGGSGTFVFKPIPDSGASRLLAGIAVKHT